MASTTPAPRRQRGPTINIIPPENVPELALDDDHLAPDLVNAADFEVDPKSPFAFSVGQLNKLINPKSLGAFHALGGLVGLTKGLRTDSTKGLSNSESHFNDQVSFEDATAGKESKEFSPTQAVTDTDASKHYLDRTKIYKDNSLPKRKPKSFWYLVWAAYNDKMILLLTAAAVISLALGIYEAVDAKQKNSNDPDKQTAWIEGVAIVVAIIVVVSAGALNDWQKEKQFAKLNAIKESRLINVVRSGETIQINIDDILVGDVVKIEAGDVLPADGVVINCQSLVCDESSVTGESDQLRKTPATVAYEAIRNRLPLRKIDPFIISGAQVTEGVGTFLVTSTGVNSSHGKLMLSLQDEPTMTPLQSKLNVLAEYIAKLGLTAGLLLFVATAIRFGVRVSGSTALDGSEIGQQFLNLFIVAVTVVVVAVPEGLPLAVTLALSFATTKMLKDKNLVRRMQACETMGNATTICSDKTGTLTQNKMTVIAGVIGSDLIFEDPEDYQEASKNLHNEIKELLVQSIAVNSTVFESEIGLVGSKTETALIEFAKNYLGMPSLQKGRDQEIVQLFPFDSDRKAMATVIKTHSGYRVLVKGASEIILSKSDMIHGAFTPVEGSSRAMEKDREVITTKIDAFANSSLRTIGVAYKDYQQWPPAESRQLADNGKHAVFEDVCKGLIFLSLFGIRDPLRDGVADAVLTCQKAGVTVRMVTGDNLLTAKAIAKDANILTDERNIMEGQEFRNLSAAEIKERLPSLQVLARSSPADKKLLVQRLQAMEQVVAVTGDGTNDAPALNTADVGFSMGIAGTEVAKMASDIILMDDNFTSIVKAISWGRAVNDAVKKFLQFQVTVNITAVVLTFVSALSSDTQTPILSAVQLLWVNLIMDTLAALALATDPPTAKLLERKPDKKGASLISTTMWKMIIGQSIFQLVVTLVLYYVKDGFYGLYEHMGLPATPQDNANFVLDQEAALIFNTFVWMQIFNQYNSRRLDNGYNLFEGLFRIPRFLSKHKSDPNAKDELNWYFWAIQIIIVGGQVLIMFVGKSAFNLHEELTATQWATSVIIGLMSIPMGMIIRTIPDEWVARPVRFLWALIPGWMKHTPWYYIRRLFGKKNKAPDVESHQMGGDDGPRWHEGIEDIADSLWFAKWLHGGRLRQVRSKVEHPLEVFKRQKQITPPTSALSTSRPGSSIRHSPRSRANSGVAAAAAMSGIVAGAIAGWGGPPSASSERASPNILDGRDH